MRETMSAWARRAAVVSLVALVVCVAWAEASWDVAGRWLIDGAGHGEKGFVRLRLSLDGTMDIHASKDDEGRRWLTGWDIDLRIGTTRADIRTWRDHIEERLHVPVPLPELRPTVSDPFELPPVTHEGLTYRVTLTSESSGKVRISGWIDLDVIGKTDIDSESAIWKAGTPKPDLDSSVESGCDAGLGGACVALLLALAWRSCQGRRRGERF